MNTTEEDLRVAKEVTPQFQYEPDGRYGKRVRRVARAFAKQRESIKKLLNRLPQNSQVADCIDAIDGDTHLLD